MMLVIDASSTNRAIIVSTLSCHIEKIDEVSTVKEAFETWTPNHRLIWFNPSSLSSAHRSDAIAFYQHVRSHATNVGFFAPTTSLGMFESIFATDLVFSVSVPLSADQVQRAFSLFQEYLYALNFPVALFSMESDEGEATSSFFTTPAVHFSLSSQSRSMERKESFRCRFSDGGFPSWPMSFLPSSRWRKGTVSSYLTSFKPLPILTLFSTSSTSWIEKLKQKLISLGGKSG